MQSINNMSNQTLSTRKIADLDVSVLCLGTMTFGKPVERDDAIRIVHWALDHGINFIDTADMYEGYDRYLGSPGGVAETFVGEALKDRRQKAIVTTKVGNPIGGREYEGKGLSRPHILHQIDASLANAVTSAGIGLLELQLEVVQQVLGRPEVVVE